MDNIKLIVSTLDSLTLEHTTVKRSHLPKKYIHTYIGVVIPKIKVLPVN